MTEPSVEEIVAKAERWLERGGDPQLSDDEIRALIADWRARGDAMDSSEALALKLRLERDSLRADWRKRGEALAKVRREIADTARLVACMPDQRPVAWLVTAMGSIDSALTPQRQLPAAP